MLNYRHIQNEPELYARQIWDREEKLPQWYKDASNVWHPTYESFEEFWKKSCREIWGMFNNDDLQACVYLEYLSLISVNIHVSVIAPVNNRDLIRFFTSLKDHKARDGVQMITGWLLAKNRGLIDVARAAGLYPSGARMSYGASSRGKVFEWVQLIAN